MAAVAPHDTILHGDALAMLRTLPDASVQMCCSSPPYWNLRDYGTARWEGGNDPRCDHMRSFVPRAARTKSGETSGMARGGASNDAQDIAAHAYRDRCGKCGARRVDDQIGLETTPDAYVARLVEVFREVRRVLRADGTLWLNIGDSFAANMARGVGRKCGTHGLCAIDSQEKPARQVSPAMKPKDLVGIPWMLAFALRADGWWLRSDVIWHKPNCMPSSVRDRPTSSYEHVFLLSKRARYYYDADAIKEPVKPSSLERNKYKPSSYAETVHNIRGLRAAKGSGTKADGRNKRDVWNIYTRPYKGAHFAVMPPALVEPCVMAGSRPGDLVLDPFGGSGTVGAVAKALGRRYLLIDLNPAYCDLATDRIAHVHQPSLWTPDAA